MSITTLDGILAGAQYPRFFSKAPASSSPGNGTPFSLWSSGGYPGAGAFDTTLNGVTLSGTSANVAGQIPFTDPGSGNTYLTRLAAASQNNGTLMLCDRLWHNGGFTITSTTAQSITSPTWPARDANGATSGAGVLLGLEISSVVGSGGPTVTISYTNQAGTSGRTATNSDLTSSGAPLGYFFRIGLQAGDTGVRSVQSLTLSGSWTSGTMNLVAYRPIAELEICNDGRSSSAGAGAIDSISSGFPIMYNGTVPFLIWKPIIANTVHISGSVSWTQG